MSSEITIRHGDSPAMIERFAELGAAFYAGDDHPAAPTTSATLALLGPDNPTRQRCQLNCFLVDGAHRGRVAAIVNPRLCGPDGAPYGLLGFFECDDHAETASQLFGSASDWLTQQGCKLVRGPINFTTWHNYRLLTKSNAKGFIPGEPYHPDHYPRLWTGAGFTTVARYSSNWLGDAAYQRDRVAPRAAESRAAGYRLRNFTGSDLDFAYSLSSAAFSAAWMFSPITREEFVALYPPAKLALASSLSHVAFAEDGQPVGYIFVIPAQIDGRRASVCKTVAVHPDHRDKGVYQLLGHRWVSDAIDNGCTDVIPALMHCDGPPALLGWVREETCIREYRVYEREL